MTKARYPNSRKNCRVFPPFIFSIASDWFAARRLSHLADALDALQFLDWAHSILIVDERKRP
jgi:hypothetical protein